jgi:hypothetical protein
MPPRAVGGCLGMPKRWGIAVGLTGMPQSVYGVGGSLGGLTALVEAIKIEIPGSPFPESPYPPTDPH